MSRRPSRRWLLVHGLVVGVLLAVLALLVATSDPADGANIGAGLVGLPLLALGLPWSLVVLVDPYRFDDLSGAARWVVYVGPAVLNVLLHALVVELVARRRR